jgi:hypothetical protein
MKLSLIIIAVLVGAGLLVLFIRSRIAPTYHVAAREIPEVIRQLQSSGKDGNFAVFMFVPPNTSDREAINLQYSVEQGVVGFDWVLIGPRNVADKPLITELANGLGYHLEEQEANNVRYMRMTGNGISEFGVKVIRDLYKIDPDTKLEMITEGFEWQPIAP